MAKSICAAIGNTLRGLGRTVDSIGVGFEAGCSYTEKLVPSTRIVANAGRSPSIGRNAFVAPNAAVIGQVEVGEGASIWYGATVRGDVNHIKIGANSSIGDRAIVHVAKIAGDHPTVIGSHVTVGAGATVHAATLQDKCIVGIGAQVLDGAVVEERAMVAAGAVVTPGTVVKSKQLWAGCPAKAVRDLEANELAMMESHAAEIGEMAGEHLAETSKTFEQIEADKKAWKKGLWVDPHLPKETEEELKLHRRGMIYDAKQ